MSQNLVNIEIDGKPVAVPAGSMVMHGANALGIYVPHFCYHKKLSIAANCRMCLVQVEKAPKPLPACATPVTEGMKVWTRSELAIQAQKGVMEFLLINHPLDCPICDQGGECQLQDLAVGYGGVSSRYQEEKRAVANKNLGPLISTDMTRCIHCTRCVRFGQEVAGIMELGMANRGEHSEIMAFVGRTVDSEVSGNVIDLCPVGALTSKPFRFSARSWEMARRRTVSPHCGLGSNLVAQVKLGRVLRMLPLENEQVNECWLSDKDRFSYEGLYSPDRLNRPMIRRESGWRECDWQEALEFVLTRLSEIRERHGATAIGALASPHSTLEELYLLQKFVRGLGSGNVDFRLRQSDFRADTGLQGAPWLGMAVTELNALGSVLVVGSTLRKDHPLLAHRLRQAAGGGCELNLVNPVDDDLLCAVANKLIVPPSALADALAQVVKACADIKGVALPGAVERALQGVAASEAAKNIAASLTRSEPVAILLGNLAQHHPGYRDLHALAQCLADVTGARFGFLGEAANSVGGYLAGAVPRPPHAQALAGKNVAEMLAGSLKAFLLLGLEPELDCHDSGQAQAAMRAAEFVVAMSPWKHCAQDYADVLLPIAPFTETAGTFVSSEGRIQCFSGVATPVGESRPAWKVLRVLGSLAGLAGFGQDTVEEVRTEMGVSDGVDVSERLENRIRDAVPGAQAEVPRGLQRIGEVPIYFADPLVRRAESLQQTRDGRPVAAMNAGLMTRFALRDGDLVSVRQGAGEAVLPVREDDRLPEDCIRVPAGHPITAGLGAMFGEVTAHRAEIQQRMAG